MKHILTSASDLSPTSQQDFSEELAQSLLNSPHLLALSALDTLLLLRPLAVPLLLLARRRLLQDGIAILVHRKSARHETTRVAARRAWSWNRRERLGSGRHRAHSIRSRNRSRSGSSGNSLTLDLVRRRSFRKRRREQAALDLLVERGVALVDDELLGGFCFCESSCEVVGGGFRGVFWCRGRGGGAIVGVEAWVEGEVGEDVDAWDQLTDCVRAGSRGARLAQRHAGADGEGFGVGDVGEGNGWAFTHDGDGWLFYCRSDSLGGSAVFVFIQLQSRNPRDAWQSGRSSGSTRHCLDAHAVHHVLEGVEALAFADASRVSEHPRRIDLVIIVNCSDRGRSGSDGTGRLV